MSRSIDPLVSSDPLVSILAGRIRAGDAAAESQLVMLISRTVRAIIRHRCFDRTLADDLYQDVFLLLLLRLRSGDVREPRALLAFINSAVGHYVANHGRKQRRRRTDGGIEAPAVADPAPCALSRIVNDEEARAVHRAIRSLVSQRDRIVLQRLYLEHDDRECIRNDLALTSAQFDRVLSRARGRLREVLAKTMSRWCEVSPPRDTTQLRMSYPKFNPIHPPRPRGRLKVAERTETKIEAETRIDAKDFVHVLDPRYPWQTMRRGSPNEYAARDKIKTEQTDAVAHYELTRGVYWAFIDSVKPGKRTLTVRDLLTTSTKQTDKTVQTFEQTLSQTLGSTITAGGKIEGIDLSASRSSEFKAELKHSLEVTHEVERSISAEHETTEETETEEGVTYLLWRKRMELDLYRFAKNAGFGELVRRTTVDAGPLFIDPLTAEELAETGGKR